MMHSPLFSARFRSCGRAHWFVKTRTFLSPSSSSPHREAREERDSMRSAAPPPMGARAAMQLRRDKRSVREDDGAAELSEARASPG